MHLSFKRTDLWHQPNFIKLWMGQTISLFGSAITTLALPLTAISILHASAQQMGFLFALSQMSPLLFGLIPNEMQGRVNATMQVISWATAPIGALLGGWLGENIGLRPTLFVVAGGLILAQPWLLFSPLRTLRTLPTVIEPTASPDSVEGLHPSRETE